MTKIKLEVVLYVDDYRLEEYGIDPEDLCFYVTEEDVLDGVVLMRETVKGISPTEDFFVRDADILSQKII